MLLHPQTVEFLFLTKQNEFWIDNQQSRCNIKNAYCLIHPLCYISALYSWINSFGSPPLFQFQIKCYEECHKCMSHSNCLPSRSLQLYMELCFLMKHRTEESHHQVLQHTVWIRSFGGKWRKKEPLKPVMLRFFWRIYQYTLHWELKNMVDTCDITLAVPPD